MKNSRTHFGTISGRQTSPDRRSFISAAILFAEILALLWTSGCRRVYTDRQLFDEAVRAGRGADKDDQDYILEEIAKAQARHGYYDDALATSRLVTDFPELLFGDIVEARAKSGDIAGAKKMAPLAPTQEASWWAGRAIGLAQVDAGDLSGARNTVRPLPPRFREVVLREIGFTEAKKGDIEAALATASEIDSEGGWSYGILDEVVTKLRERGDCEKVLQIAKQMHTRTSAQVAKSGRIRSPTEPTKRVLKSLRGDSARGVDCLTVADVHAKRRDADGTERALRACTETNNPSNISAYMADTAKAFAAQGDVSAALRFADAGFIPDAVQGGEGYVAPAFREIAHAWAKNEGPVRVLKWARSRPTGYERAMALLGVAESFRGTIHSSTKPRP